MEILYGRGDIELGFNFSHIQAKSLTVLNPLQRIDEHIMDDADLAGPLLFWLCFGTFLLFVSLSLSLYMCYLIFIPCLFQSGKAHFGYIYGVGLLGSISIYTLLNLMSEKGIDAYCVASVLGYCLLPMVGVGAISVMVILEYVTIDLYRIAFMLFLPYRGTLGYMLSVLSILWCTYAASGIFVAVLQMSDQRLLVAYPVGLLYGCFALLSIFNVGSGSN